MTLFEEASKSKYDYYHLLSGVDLPLKAANVIDDFFEEHPGRLFMDCIAEDAAALWTRVRYCTDYYHFMRLYRFPHIGGRCDKLIVYLQKLLGISRLAKDGFRMYKGANWVSIPHDAVEFLLSQKDFIFKRFHHTCCCDEIYKHTVLLNNSFFRERLFKPEDSNMSANLRLIAWDNPGYLWTMADKDKILASNNFFARKFSMKADESIVNLMDSNLPPETVS